MRVPLVSDTPLRLVLLKDEVRRLPETWREICIRSGRAWLTLDGRDVFLKRGQTFDFVSSRDFGLISPVGRVPLVVEIRLDERRPAAGLSVLSAWRPSSPKPAQRR